MYRGFKLELLQNSYSAFLTEGNNLHAEQFNNAKDCLTNFILKGNMLDGSAIQNFWFPQIEADLFLSHSHKDLDQAKALAGWIKATFNLNVFIDSSVWLHAKDLKRELANQYCKIEGSTFYDYDAFSHASTHVDIMLSSALSLMIDKCECLFFLNTPHSVQPYQNMPRTESAWIYNEIGISKSIQKNKPIRWLNESIQMVETFSKGFSFDGISYELDLDHLTSISNTELNNWEPSKNKMEHRLDTLYKLVNTQKKSTFIH